jgi:cbb3-type cytochrome oxidase maturation protein
MLWTISAIVIMFFIGLAAWFVFLWAAGQFDDVDGKHQMMDDES